MATDTQKPNDQNSKPSLENPNKTLDSSVAPSTNKPQDPTIDDSSAPSSSFAADGTVKEPEDPKGTGPIAGTTTAAAAPVSDIEKKIRRAERFGISVQLTEEEKRNSRAERFGTGSGSGSEVSKKSEDLKRKARAERFGIPSPPVTSDEEAKKKARLARFAPVTKTDPLEDDKRKARAIRFSSTPSNSLPQVNGNPTIEPNAAIAGKAGGGD